MKIQKIYLLILFFLVMWSLFNSRPESIIVDTKIEEIIKSPTPKENSPVYLLNLKNEKIQNILYSNVDMFVDGIAIKSSIAYEKTLNFRMINCSVFGKEVDIGSNEKEFWFWSKRMKPQALFHTVHENLQNTNLKTPFHPLWIKEIIGINSINLDNALLFKYKNYIAVVNETSNITGIPVTRIYLVDDDKCVVGHYIYDKNDKLLISAEITDFYHVNESFLPKIIHINWVEENVQIKWHLNEPIINSEINPKTWEMPNIKKKIDLNGY